MEDTRKNNNYCVYIHTSPNGKIYVGQTGDKPEKRWNNGKGYLQKKNGKYNQPAFAYAIQKYGWDNFEHEVIADNLTKEEANNFEKLLINKLDTINPKFGYNCKEGGSNGSLSEKTKKKIGKSLKGKNKKSVTQYSLSGEYIHTFNSITEVELEMGISHCRISDCCNGKRKTAGNFIWRYSEEELTNEHLFWCNEKLPNKFSKKCVAQYSLSGELICVFESMTKAELETGIFYPNISAVCNGKQKTAGGYIWKYYEDISENLM